MWSAASASTQSPPSPSPSPFPPIIAPNSTHNNNINPTTTITTTTNRRCVALMLIIGTLSPSLEPLQPAFAFGISGPRDWLKDQKKKSIKYLLAPIDASRDILRYAYDHYLTLPNDEIQGLIKSAARDCVPQERNSLVAFQAKTGVEVCTFKLVVKNAASLLDDDDPIKVEADNMLNDLVTSFAFLIDGVTKDENDRDKVADALMATLSSLDNFERAIKGCIGV